MSYGDTSMIVQGLRKLARTLARHAREEIRAGNDSLATELADQASEVETIADGWESGLAPERPPLRERTDRAVEPKPDHDPRKLDRMLQRNSDRPT